MMHKTRSGVLGAERNKSGRPRSRRVTETTLSDMAQHNFAGTPPANRHEIADAAADHQTCRATVMSQEAVRVKDRSGKQAAPVLAGDHLAAV